MSLLPKKVRLPKAASTFEIAHVVFVSVVASCPKSRLLVMTTFLDVSLLLIEVCAGTVASPEQLAMHIPMDSKEVVL